MNQNELGVECGTERVRGMGHTAFWWGD